MVAAKAWLRVAEVAAGGKVVVVSMGGEMVAVATVAKMMAVVRGEVRVGVKLVVARVKVLATAEVTTVAMEAEVRAVGSVVVAPTGAVERAAVLKEVEAAPVVPKRSLCSSGSRRIPACQSRILQAQAATPAGSMHQTHRSAQDTLPRCCRNRSSSPHPPSLLQAAVVVVVSVVLMVAASACSTTKGLRSAPATSLLNGPHRSWYAWPLSSKR